MKKLQTVIAFVILAVTTMTGTAMAGDGGNCTKQDVIGLDPNTPATGSSTFCAVRGGLKAQVHLADLVPGHAYTAWWIYFDDPSTCAVPYECGPPDFFGDDPQAVLGRMSSGVANSNGRVNFSGGVPGMMPTPGSQVWLFTFGHGPAAYGDGKRLARQLMTPEDPGLGAPHLGNWVDGLLGYPVALNIFFVD